MVSSITAARIANLPRLHENRCHCQRVVAAAALPAACIRAPQAPTTGIQRCTAPDGSVAYTRQGLRCIRRGPCPIPGEMMTRLIATMPDDDQLTADARRPRVDRSALRWPAVARARRCNCDGLARRVRAARREPASPRASIGSACPTRRHNAMMDACSPSSTATARCPLLRCADHGCRAETRSPTHDGRRRPRRHVADGGPCNARGSCRRWTWTSSATQVAISYASDALRGRRRRRRLRMRAPSHAILPVPRR